LLLLPVALAQPQWIGNWIPQTPEGREIVLLVDGSRSMSITDFEIDHQPVDRLSVLKGIVTQFIKARDGDKFGVVIFGDHAYTLVPPTFDRDLAIRDLARVPVGVAGEETAIGEAVGMALKSLQQGAKHRAALVLFTDGDSNAGAISPKEAVEVAVHMKVPIYTVDVGTDLFGHHSKPNAVMEPGEISLRDIAIATGGRYYQAASPQALKSVITDIGKLEKTVMPPSNRRERYEWYWLPLALAGVLLTFSRLLQIRDQLS
jgi:Ca-activated chloride channel family protein